MNDNLMVVETVEDDRWNDRAWLAQQEEISAMQDAIDLGVEVG